MYRKNKSQIFVENPHAKERDGLDMAKALQLWDELQMSQERELWLNKLKVCKNINYMNNNCYKFKKGVGINHRNKNTNPSKIFKNTIGL